MTSLSTLESEVLDKLLAGKHDWLGLLRRQARVIQVQSHTLTGTGFVTNFLVPADAPRLPGDASFRLGDVSADVNDLEHGAGFILWVNEGALHSLEGYSYEEAWPEVINSFRVYYTGGGERNEEAVAKYISAGVSKGSAIH